MTETALPFLMGLPRGIDDAGNIYAGYLSGISRTAPNGEAVMLAGSGLSGRRDGRGGDAEFVGLSFLDDYSPLLQVTEDGDVVVLDGPGSDVTTLRRIDLAAGLKQ